MIPVPPVPVALRRYVAARIPYDVDFGAPGVHRGLPSTTITLVVFGLLVAAILPGTRHRLRRVGERGYVLVGGIIMPTVVLLTLSGLTVFTISRTQDSGTTDLTVVGHQYWWEVRYPGSDAVTANEIHIPAGKKVRLALRSDDVIHSFWVPSLAGKVDMIPGRTNQFEVTPKTVGEYRGKCAELCGEYHSRMLFNVKVVTRAEYDAHLADLKAKGQTGQLPNSLNLEQLAPGETEKIPTPGGN